MNKICCFIGHRDAPENLYPQLAEAVERHITAYGVTDFLVGGYGAFDRMAARAVGEAKTRHPGVALYLMLAFFPTGHSPELTEAFDGAIYPEGQETIPHKAAIPRLNRRMVEDADYLIAYVKHISGGSYEVLRYAQTRQTHGLLAVTNLAALA